jgi:hypothetical protein
MLRSSFGLLYPFCIQRDIVKDALDELLLIPIRLSMANQVQSGKNRLCVGHHVPVLNLH